MNLSSFVRALVLGLAVALPMVFPFTQAPNPNFWPLMVAWGCGLLGVWRAVVVACVVRAFGAGRGG